MTHADRRRHIGRVDDGIPPGTVTAYARAFRPVTDSGPLVVQVPPASDRWPGGTVPERIPPGPALAKSGTFDGFTPMPRVAPEPVESRYVVHIPLVARSDASAVAAALQIANLVVGVVPEAIAIDTKVTRERDMTNPRPVFCRAIVTAGERCARLFAHDGHHDPNWQAMVPPGTT
jgi:hypothetical protein